MVRRLSVIPALAMLLLLGACGELQDWRGTQRADTLEAYQSFLERHPQSQYAPVAQRRLADLEEQRDWLIATESDSAEGYRTFIDTHPKGRWTREARLRLQNFLATPGVIGPAAIEPVEPMPPPAMLPAAPDATETPTNPAPRESSSVAGPTPPATKRWSSSAASATDDVAASAEATPAAPPAAAQKK